MEKLLLTRKEAAEALNISSAPSTSASGCITARTS